MIPYSVPEARIARGEAIFVTYEPVVGEGRKTLPEGSVSVLMPGHNGAVRLDYVALGGRVRHLEAADPMVGVMCAQPQLELELQQATGDMLTITLEPPLLASRAPRLSATGQATTASDPYLRRLGETLIAGFRKSVAPSRGFLDGIAGEVAAHLEAHYALRRHGRVGGLAPHRLERVKALIQQQLGEKLRVEDLAEAICMSPFHFARMFKQSTGESPHAYITRVRVGEAKRLLASTPTPIAEIARQLGFGTQSHFTGVFHQQSGTTPRAYRVAHRTAESD